MRETTPKLVTIASKRVGVMSIAHNQQHLGAWKVIAVYLEAEKVGNCEVVPEH